MRPTPAARWSRQPFSFRLGLFGVLAIAVPSFAATPDSTKPDTRPTGQPGEGKELLKSSDGKPDPATKPATKPSTKPAAQVSPDAQVELDALRSAYKNLTSLRVAGTISSEINIAGQSQNNTGGFEATFQSAPDTLGRFRHSTREGIGGASKDGLVVGSTGDKLYVFDPARKSYMSGDAPKARGSADDLGKPYSDLLGQQNPSLLLALTDDAAVEVLDDVVKAEKTDDVQIGGEPCPALKLTGEKGVEVTLALDPKTHLVRRLTTDLKRAIEQRGQVDVNRATFTIEYTLSEPGAAVADDQFAWTPPQGAKDVTERVAAAAAADGEGADPASAMEGKPAPDFKLKGLDGKEVALSDLKGSVVLIDFWATWCGPCVASLPKLNKLYDEKKGAGLKAFAIDLKEDKEDVETFVKEKKLTIPVLLDSDGKVAASYKVRGIPTTLVVAKDGTVKKLVVGSGEKNHAALEKAVEEAMKAKSE